jgi:hypothetical protein
MCSVSTGGDDELAYCVTYQIKILPDEERNKIPPR